MWSTSVYVTRCRSLTLNERKGDLARAIKILVMPLLRKVPLTLLLACLLCQGQSTYPTVKIRVRALDYKTGRPLKGHAIAMWLSDGSGQIQLHKSEELMVSTNKDGTAVFQVKEPLPLKVTVDTRSLRDWNCSATWKLTTSEIWEHGIVGQYTLDRECKKKGSLPATSPVPGEVVIYVHQLGVFGRLYRLYY